MTRVVYTGLTPEGLRSIRRLHGTKSTTRIKVFGLLYLFIHPNDVRESVSNENSSFRYQHGVTLGTITRRRGLFELRFRLPTGATMDLELLVARSARRVGVTLRPQAPRLVFLVRRLSLNGSDRPMSSFAKEAVLLPCSRFASTNGDDLGALRQFNVGVRRALTRVRGLDGSVHLRLTVARPSNVFCRQGNRDLTTVSRIYRVPTLHFGRNDEGLLLPTVDEGGLTVLVLCVLGMVLRYPRHVINVRNCHPSVFRFFRAFRFF